MAKTALVWLKVLKQDQDFWMGFADGADDSISDNEKGVSGVFVQVDDYDYSDHQFLRVRKTLLKDSAVTILIPRQHVVAIVEVANQVNPLGFVTDLKKARHNLGAAKT
jgi:hypothetical protein